MPLESMGPLRARPEAAAVLGARPPSPRPPYQEFCVFFSQEIIPLTEGVTELEGQQLGQGSWGIELEKPTAKD